MSSLPPDVAPALRVRLMYNTAESAAVAVYHDIPLDPECGPAHRRYLEDHADEWPPRSSPTVYLHGTAAVSFAAHKREAYRTLTAQFGPDNLKKRIFSRDLARLTDGELADFLRPFVTRGYEVYHNLFESFELDRVSRKLVSPEVARDLLREYLATPGRRVIFKVPPAEQSEPFPWGFLFNRRQEALKTRADYIDACWGLNYQIEDAFKWTRDQRKQRRFNNSPRRILAAVCPRADQAGRHATAGHPLTRRHAGVDYHCARESFFDALKAVDADVVYFFGHAEIAAHDIQADNWIELDMARLTALDLQAGFSPKYLRKTVLAFLNGCETVPIRLLGPTSVLGQFTQKQATEGVRVRCVATSYHIPTTFAGAFAEQFWDSFLPAEDGREGKTLGEALLAAKRVMLDRYNNPLGVLYTLFGDGGLRFGDTTAAS